MPDAHKGISAGKTHATKADLDLIVVGNYEEHTVAEWVNFALEREATILKLVGIVGVEAWDLGKETCDWTGELRRKYLV